ncbi:MAG: hypothetical protein OEY70_03730, partial [Acidimicrobiia bacterium]|nr:hypothetical protein [Acidimicrobiia bacterium]
GHLVATVAVVTITANHYWLDGLACIALLVPLVALLTGRRHPEAGSAPEAAIDALAVHRATPGAEPAFAVKTGGRPGH